MSRITASVQKALTWLGLSTSSARIRTFSASTEAIKSARPNTPEGNVRVNPAFAKPGRPETIGTILVVDDAPEILELYGDFIRTEFGDNIDVVVIDPQQPIKEQVLALVAGQQPIDLIFMDEEMPGIRGSDLAALLRRDGYSGYIVANSSNGMTNNLIARTEVADWANPAKPDPFGCLKKYLVPPEQPLPQSPPSIAPPPTLLPVSTAEGLEISDNFPVPFLGRKSERPTRIREILVVSTGSATASTLRSFLPQVNVTEGREILFTVLKRVFDASQPPVDLVIIDKFSSAMSPELLAHLLRNPAESSRFSEQHPFKGFILIHGLTPDDGLRTLINGADGIIEKGKIDNFAADAFELPPVPSGLTRE